MSEQQQPLQERLRWNCKLQDRWERGVLACDVEVLASIQPNLTQFCFSSSSPNNFDKHASHLAVGVSQERNNKFNDMSVVFINLLIPQLSDKTDDERAAKADLGVLHKVAFPLMMQVLSEANLVCSEVCLPRHPGMFLNLDFSQSDLIVTSAFTGHLVLHARSDHSRPSVDPVKGRHY